ncbi:MAG: hypothetical protein IJ525_02980 [Alphaproteobacteria bacterium]|nr:hypothetical protein [Alphaproteobacteria bacterium]
MSGFFGWFLVFIAVLAVFNAEKLPAIRQMLENKFKDSLEAAKEGSKVAKDKIKQVKTDIENKKAAAANVEQEPEENTPEEIEESLKFMDNIIKEETAKKEQSEKPEEKKEEVIELPEVKEPDPDAPISLDNHD